MIDLPWRLFSQTGNIETYLLMKELEAVYEDSSIDQLKDVVREYDQSI